MMKQVAYKKNAMKSFKTMAGYRYGFRMMWKGCPKFLKKIKMKGVGEYDKRNQHGGEMYALPGDFRLTEKQAATILYKCFLSKKFTISEMKQIKKSLAYAYMLDGGIPGKNYSTIPGIWEIVTDAECHEQKRRVLPEKIPTVDELRLAFTTPWSRETGWGLADWSRGLVAAWDWCILGARYRTDMTRIKEGNQHGLNVQEGWGWTSFKGGRAKLVGKKKGTRPWKAWRCCMCPGKKHKGLPEDFEYSFDNEGTPTMEISWCTSCPVNCMELILKGQFRQAESNCPVWSHCCIYRKWSKSSGRFGKAKQGEIMTLINRWMKVQGVEADYDTNAGRKSLARWLKTMQVPYEESFEIHGDLEDVFRKYYQPSLPKSGYEIRTQSDDPEAATQALRRFATFCGRGSPPKVKMNMTARLVHRLLVNQGDKEGAMRAVYGLPSDDEEEEENQAIDLSMPDFEAQHCILVDDEMRRRRKRRKLNY